MSGDMKDFPLGPPPSYDTVQDVFCVHDGLVTSKSSNILTFEDSPPYKEKESSTESVSGFQFLFPLIMRPWKRFFGMCSRCRWSTSAENFGYNLTYYQVNYAWMMLILVIVALLVIDSDDFNFCILWTSVSVLLIYVLNISGFAPELFGRKLSLSEQLTAMIMFELPCYGLLPGAVPFIYFLAPFTGFVMFHACFTPINKAAVGISAIHHV